MAKTQSKTIELWDGYEVKVNEQLFDDVDFLADFSKAAHNNDIVGVMTMLFAVVGGEKVYDDARKYVEEQYGYFSMKELRPILDKIEDCFPKAGNRALRRHSWSSK